MKRQKPPGLRKAIKKAGSQRALAEMLGLQQSAVSNWLNRDRVVPAERILDIERVTGVPRQELRPDLYKFNGQAA